MADCWDHKRDFFFKHNIYWITSKIQSSHLFRFFHSPFHIFYKWPASQLILEEHREECGLYFMTCNQWTCSISFRDEFKDELPLQQWDCKVMKGSLHTDVSNLRWKMKFMQNTHTPWGQQLPVNDLGYTAQLSWSCRIIQSLKHHDIPLPAWNPNAKWKLLNQWITKYAVYSLSSQTMSRNWEFLSSSRNYNQK